MTWQALYVVGGIRRIRHVVEILSGAPPHIDGAGYTTPGLPQLAEAVYLPAIASSSTETRALLDGYLFAVIDAAAIKRHPMLAGVRPVGRVTDAEIAVLRAVELHGVGAARPWVPGELLEITRGPFAGLVGAFDTRAKRWGILVRIECLGRELVVEVDQRIARRLSRSAHQRRATGRQRGAH